MMTLRPIHAPRGAAARWRHRLLVLEAMARVAAASLALRLVPVHRLLAPGLPMADDAIPSPEALRIAAALRAAVRRAPRLGLCLARALALRRMLARRGIACAIHLSVGRAGAKGIKGHAWVTIGTAVLVGGGPGSGQVPIFTSRTPPPQAPAKAGMGG